MYSPLLEKITTSGISEIGAKAQNVSPGPEGSHRLALIDLDKLLQYRLWFMDSGRNQQVPPALLAGICSRETRGRNIIGDHGNGIGLMQIDKRYHVFAKSSQSMVPKWNIAEGARVLASYWRILRGQIDKGNWTLAEKLRGAIVAYNSGVGNVQTVEHMDVGTTQNDYSADVWERARALLPFFMEKEI